MDVRDFKYYISALIIQLIISGNVADVYAQERTFQPPTFGNLSYQEIQIQELEAFDKEDWKKLSDLVNFHLSKARTENNNLEMARGYYYKYVLEEPEIALKYTDSIINITKGSTHPNYPTLGYSLKGHSFYTIGNFPLALENYLIAYNLAVEKNNREHQREISLAIAAIRNINGQNYAAAELYKSSLKLLKEQNDYQIDHYHEFLTLLYNLSLTHLRLMEIDSAKVFSDQGISLSVANRDIENYRDFILLDAQINYYKNRFYPARDTLYKYLNDLEGTRKAIKLFYLGQIEEKLGNPELATNNYKKIDSIVSFTNDPFPEVKDVYQQLIMDAIGEDDKRKQIEYIGKLIYYDSILSKGKEEVHNMAIASYDIPFLKHQKRRAEEQIKIRERYVLLASLFAGMGTVSGLFFYRRTRRMKTKLQILLSSEVGNLQNLHRSNPAKQTHADIVPEDIRNDLLRKLGRFEETERFLDKDLDMSALAEELGTNTSYLSVVINHYKKMSFPNYLKDLRIVYAINRLKKDPQLLKYNYQGLADLFGFKTGESFSKAFFKKTGVYPSKFLNELKSREIKGDL